MIACRQMGALGLAGALSLVSAAASAGTPLIVPDMPLCRGDSVAGGTPEHTGAQAGPTAVFRGADGGSFVIETSYEQGAWSGSVVRRALTISSSGVPSIAQEPAWDAATGIGGNAGAPPAITPSERQIFTLGYQNGETSSTIAFAWDSLPGELRSLLDVPLQGAPADGLGQARAGYLRGQREREIGHPKGIFRARKGVLGDTIHSTPLIMGAPNASQAGRDYAEFHARHKDRSPVVFVGANDGMLHAFDADSGAELFAYVPNALIAKLNQLSSPEYRHRPYVDGNAGTGEAHIGGRWRSVLVGGMGLGARGVYALDVTTPGAFASGLGALWEFTGQDDPYMGHVRDTPLIVRLQTGTRDHLPQYRHFALVSSGINNRTDNGDAALFLLALDKPASEPWQQGHNYIRMIAPNSAPSQPNLLAAPALVNGPDGSVRHAYAGDLHGNLWRFDLSGQAAAKLLFVAHDESGRRQPITHAPKAVFAPGSGYLVLFGTGRLIEQTDLNPDGFAPQSFYALHDSLENPHALPASRAQLAMRSLSGSTSYRIDGAAPDYGGPNAKQGWYFDFPHAGSDGERMAGSPAVVSGTVIFRTLLPGSEACTGLSERTYIVAALSGYAFGADGIAQAGASTGELTPDAGAVIPMLFETLVHTVPAGATGSAFATRTFTLMRIGAGNGALTAQSIKVRFPARRLSWREVSNWPELHQAATQ